MYHTPWDGRSEEGKLVLIQGLLSQVGGVAPGADDNTLALSAGRGWAAFLASEKPVIPGARKTAQLGRA